MFKGTATALITPFNKEKELDIKNFEKLINDQIENNINALVILGTTGESPTINEKEKYEIIKKAIEITNKKIPIIVGTGSNDTKKILKNNKIAEELNADGLLIVTPYYNKTTQNGLYENYKYISQNTKLPIVLYNVPSRTGLNIEPKTTIKLLKNIENIIGIKEASGNISQINKILNEKPKNKYLYSGNDDQIIPIMANGGDGVISVISNLIPKQISKMTENILQKKYEEALEINNKYLNLMNMMFEEVNPIPIKYAMSLKYKTENTLRLPLISVTKELEEKIKKEMKRVEII
ncbi:4-hydroxy-tetrahydrodipicolinate synthase [Oceanotoga sp. DSM 15011]|jgi:4-hydroxy-tetrahydrodipicolinate synthase|uniref:4-hydroxy-tetrahydrodipicolinate synthase n=1 Tax=Oceanotoga teriensis TaxID=515440 RepID=A0AA45C7D3_9BACT|nr:MULTISPECIES: 4-hydroxy-tetrahydrodipicolinate synthase [Oceanotoga]MDN5342675.1 4-hydroxy-tetrahydrodipicolinate synthase [Oceanotoga sp.]MDO7976755.1 4-hydroxy-tetrahydrodipicolinate synthase [Oceanotoga teriensis]PWJ95265.1 dihydrodipicolinate synthase [Oceanotoga teriensis]UYP00612.1 4-hydroxy-tetrahydrodipicolinate synthase [Oceanotoga sp. DSM 15011]